MTPQRTQKRSNGKPGAVAATSRRLRELIVRGTLAPGAPLIERDIAARLRVGRTTVQSALQILEREGYVISAKAGKYSRSTVAPLTVEDMQDMHELLGALNGMAARMVATRDKPFRRVLAEELDRLNGALREAARSEPVRFTAVYECDQRFHKRCVDASGNRRIKAIYESTAPQRERYGRMYATALADKSTASVREHAGIIAAIRKGDPNAAELAAATNFLNAAARFRAVIETLGERGSW